MNPIQPLKEYIFDSIKIVSGAGLGIIGAAIYQRRRDKQQLVEFQSSSTVFNNMKHLDLNLGIMKVEVEATKRKVDDLVQNFDEHHQMLIGIRDLMETVSISSK